MGEVRTAGLSWYLGSGCVYKRPEGTLVYSVHEPAMPSALLSGYKKGPETGSGVGRGASGSGSGVTEEEPDGAPRLVNSTCLSTVLTPEPLAQTPHHPHLRFSRGGGALGKVSGGKGGCILVVRRYSCRTVDQPQVGPKFWPTEGPGPAAPCGSPAALGGGGEQLLP